MRCKKEIKTKEDTGEKGHIIEKLASSYVESNAGQKDIVKPARKDIYHMIYLRRIATAFIRAWTTSRQSESFASQGSFT